MVAFRIHFVKWERRPDRHNMEGPFFRVFAKAQTHSFWSIHALITPSDIDTLQHEIGVQGFHEKDRVQQTVIRYAIQRIENRLREGLFPTEPSHNTDNWSLEEADVLVVLRQLLQEKTCTYQLQEGRDLLCSAASAEDKTVYHGKSGFRFIAPTSRALCYTCTLPDTDYLCAHFLHPEVHATRDSGARDVRQLVRGMCDIGRPEVQQPEQCHADGHSCWEWLVEQELAHPVTPMSPLALPEAFDYLNACWRLAFGKKQSLFHRNNLTGVAMLSLSCATRDELSARLSALADVLNSMCIPDKLLTEPSKVQRGIFNRLKACLKGHLDAAEYPGCEHAVTILRAVNDLRVYFQHSATARELPTVCAQLSLPFPLPPCGETWERIKVTVIEALRVIREAIRRYGELEMSAT